MRIARLAVLGSVCFGLSADRGLPVGASMPAFEAKDQNGQAHTLKDILGPNGAVLLFYRSADW